MKAEEDFPKREVCGMPNIKSAKKRLLVTATKTLQNKMARSSLRTAIKRFEASVAAGDKAQAEQTMREAVKLIDKAAAGGLIHKNNAARKKSSLALRYNSLAQ
jgi:small subunit ribosomal protein S20